MQRPIISIKSMQIIPTCKAMGLYDVIQNAMVNASDAMRRSTQSVNAKVNASYAAVNSTRMQLSAHSMLRLTQ